ncbi:MAG: serine/threonine protein kinase [Acidobacteria bacterium]|nr:serine/threonine protein kinase [Acidobacteriota bacterium]
MDAELWQRIKPLFAQAQVLAPEEWDGFLSACCQDDEALCRELRALLEAGRQASSDFLEPAAPQPVSLAAQRIGSYQLLRRLGQGGMGEVYLACRADEEYHKRVAIKVLRPGMASEDLVRRFRTERQILAALDHPVIAKLLDGGTTAAGLPYFVMEYVEGQPIDRYCDGHRLTTSQRIELFCQVCEAVQFAHQNLVVHRDLKPANILVTADGTPKLLDFGIAKLLNPELSPAPIGATLAGRPMTPDYASPEQVRGEPITTASDVYSLGVLLYLLLSGHPPYRASGRSPGEMERVICETVPERMTKLIGRLAGDLDEIVLMALRKEPQRRYASVEQLAADLRRHLKGRPVLASGDSLAYRSRKFVGRHRVGVGAVAALALVIVGFAVAMGILAAQLSRERDRAVREQRRAEHVTAFLTGIFEVSDPLKTTGDIITAREILDLGAARIATQLQDQPEARAALTMTIGAIYRRLALYDRAIPLLESALATRRRLLGEEHEDVAQSLDELATARLEKGETDAAAALYGQSLNIRRKLFGNEHLAVATSLNNLANVHWAKSEYDAAGALYRRVLEMRRRQLGEEHEDVATSLNNLANVLHAQGDLGRAEQLHRNALRIRRKLLGDNHPDVGESQNNLAAVLWRKGELAEARSLYETALKVQRARFGDEHPTAVNTLGNLALVLHDLGNDAAAEPLYRQVLAYNRKTFGDRHLEVARAANNLASLRKDQGDLREAEDLYQEAVEILRESAGPRHPNLGTTLAALADLEATRGDFAVAEPRAREALEILKKVHPVGHWRIAAAESILAGCLLGLGHREEAEALLLHSQPLLASAAEGGAASRNRETLKHLVELYETLNRPGEAARYRAKLAALPNSQTR